MKATEVIIKLDTGQVLTATGADAHTLYRGMQAYETICGIVALTSGMFRNSPRVTERKEAISEAPTTKNEIGQAQTVTTPTWDYTQHAKPLGRLDRHS